MFENLQRLLGASPLVFWRRSEAVSVDGSLAAILSILLLPPVLLRLSFSAASTTIFSQTVIAGLVAFTVLAALSTAVLAVFAKRRSAITLVGPRVVTWLGASLGVFSIFCVFLLLARALPPGPFDFTHRLLNGSSGPWTQITLVVLFSSPIVLLSWWSAIGPLNTRFARISKNTRHRAWLHRALPMGKLPYIGTAAILFLANVLFFYFLLWVDFPGWLSQVKFSL